MGEAWVLLNSLNEDRNSKRCVLQQQRPFKKWMNTSTLGYYRHKNWQMKEREMSWPIWSIQGSWLSPISRADHVTIQPQIQTYHFLWAGSLAFQRGFAGQEGSEKDPTFWASQRWVSWGQTAWWRETLDWGAGLMLSWKCLYWLLTC